MTNDIINSLVDDLKPVSVLSNRRLWVFWGISLCVCIIVVLATLGIRSDAYLALKSGTMIWKPAIFLGIAVSSLLLMSDISRPDGVFNRINAIPLICSIGFLAIIVTLSPFSLDYKLSSSLECVSTITIGGVAVLLGLWKFWLVRTASPRSGTLGLLSGMAVGSLAAFAYAIHCAMDAPLYISTIYMLPIFFMMTIGYILGRTRLNW